MLVQLINTINLYKYLTFVFLNTYKDGIFHLLYSSSMKYLKCGCATKKINF